MKIEELRAVVREMAAEILEKYKVTVIISVKHYGDSKKYYVLNLAFQTNQKFILSENKDNSTLTIKHTINAGYENYIDEGLFIEELKFPRSIENITFSTSIQELLDAHSTNVDTFTKMLHQQIKLMNILTSQKSLDMPIVRDQQDNYLAVFQLLVFIDIKFICKDNKFGKIIFINKPNNGREKVKEESILIPKSIESITAIQECTSILYYNNSLNSLATELGTKLSKSIKCYDDINVVQSKEDKDNFLLRFKLSSNKKLVYLPQEKTLLFKIHHNLAAKQYEQNLVIPKGDTQLNFITREKIRLQVRE